MPSVGARIADLVDATLDAAPGPGSRATSTRRALVPFAIIAMGKTGARELNYISDVDVVYVAEAGADGDERSCPGDSDPSGFEPRPRPARGPATRLRCGPWTRTCDPRGATASSCARSSPTASTGTSGRRPGSSRRCSKRARARVTCSLGGLRGSRPALRVERLGARGLRRGRARDAPARRGQHFALPRLA